MLQENTRTHSNSHIELRMIVSMWHLCTYLQQVATQRPSCALYGVYCPAQPFKKLHRHELVGIPTGSAHTVASQVQWCAQSLSAHLLALACASTLAQTCIQHCSTHACCAVTPLQAVLYFKKSSAVYACELTL